MINIIYLVSRLKKEGPSNQALNLLSSFDKTKINPVLVTLSRECPGSTMLEDFKRKGIEVIQLNRTSFFTLWCLFDLRKIVRDREVQIIHSSGLRPDILSILLFGKKLKRCTTQRCSPEDILNVYSSRLLAMFYVMFIRRFSKIIACSKSLAEIIHAKYSLTCEYVRNGVDTSFYKPVKDEEKVLLRQEYHLPLDKKIYIVVGSLIARKNVKNIIEAFNRLNDPGKFLLIVGDGPQLTDLKQVVSFKQVLFTGKVYNPLKYIQLSDIMISSSFAEGMPNSVLEGLACGLPVLLSDITPHREIFNMEPRIGELFVNGEPGNLIERIQKTDSWDLVEKKDWVRRFTVEHLSKECMARAYENKYESLM